MRAVRPEGDIYVVGNDAGIRSQGDEIAEGTGVCGANCSVGCGVENFSRQRILPLACITTNSVTIEPIVIARPVKPCRKNA